MHVSTCSASRNAQETKSHLTHSSDMHSATLLAMHWPWHMHTASCLWAAGMLSSSRSACSDLYIQQILLTRHTVVKSYIASCNTWLSLGWAVMHNAGAHMTALPKIKRPII